MLAFARLSVHLSPFCQKLLVYLLANPSQRKTVAVDEIYEKVPNRIELRYCDLSKIDRVGEMLDFKRVKTTFAILVAFHFVSIAYFFYWHKMSGGDATIRLGRSNDARRSGALESARNAYAKHGAVPRMSPAQQYLDWKYERDAVACVFARILARKQLEHGQKTVVVTASTSAKRVAASIASQTDKAILDPSVSGLAIVMPNVAALNLLASSALELRQHAGWTVTTGALSHASTGDLVTFAICRDIPGANGALIPSEVLAFGDFEAFPATRRSPVVALELFVGTPLEFDPKDKVTPATKANLAHIEMPSLNDEAMERLKRLSGDRRLKSLGGQQDLRAKAKVSFVIPRALAEQLGCAP